ncbi:MAG: hypothetical protein H0X31_00230 [Nostocaceae cyanobacterium]|nr:hypothetical protein [Nostocaceae cyanobacterium]
MINKYESRRITLNCFAVQEICRIEGLSPDVPSNVISAAIEKLIFQLAADSAVSIKHPATAQPTVNKSGLTAMVNQMKQAKSA